MSLIISKYQLIVLIKDRDLYRRGSNINSKFIYLVLHKSPLHIYSVSDFKPIHVLYIFSKKETTPAHASLDILYDSFKIDKNNPNLYNKADSMPKPEAGIIVLTLRRLALYGIFR